MDQPKTDDARAGQVGACAMLVAAKANVAARDANGHTPVLLARAGQTAALQSLIDAGACTADHNQFGVDARGHAMTRGHAAVVEMLRLAGGAEVAVRGDTAGAAGVRAGAGARLGAEAGPRISPDV